MFLPKPIFGFCKICKEDREEDLVAHGPGVAVLMYYPCNHIQKSTKEKSFWYLMGENDKILLEE